MRGCWPPRDLAGEMVQWLAAANKLLGLWSAPGKKTWSNATAFP
jgi:hypothetical protein